MVQEVTASKMDGEAPSEETGMIRVLVVDDSAVDRKVVESLLTRGCSSGRSFKVFAVDSGKKAMELLGVAEGPDRSSESVEETIDIVLTDYCMPEMTGLELLKILKEKLAKPIPVVVMSSENESHRIRRCLIAGAEDFLLKPLRANDVQRLPSCCRAAVPGSVPCSGNKRKTTYDCKAEENSSERRARIGEVAMA